MMVDGAGWHKSHDLKLPENLRLFFLPPYSPELNFQEHLWDELREKYFHNRAFDNLMSWHQSPWIGTLRLIPGARWARLLTD